MTSLAEAYEGHVGEIRSLQRLYLGVALFLVGSLLVGCGIVAGTTDILSVFGFGTFTARKLAGLLAGLGVPAVFLGIFTVLPGSSKRVRAAAVIGASIAVLGVSLFWDAYPGDWAGYGDDVTLQVAAVYFLGIIITFWCLFTAVVNFKTRNDPGGTVKLNLTTEEGVRVVEVEKSDLEQAGGLGGVGFMGDLVGKTDAEPTAPHPGDARPASDGGSTGETISSPLDTPRTPNDAQGVSSRRTEAIDRVGATDSYCGNCAHFKYVRTDRGIQPYCGLREHEMDDMDACDEWRPNNGR